MKDKKQFLVITQNVIFVILSLFYCIFGGTFFRMQETIDSLFINNLINTVIGLIFIGIQFTKMQESILKSINMAFGLFICYNLMPILLQQKSMFGVIIIFELIIVLYTIITQLRTNDDVITYSSKERIIYGVIVIIFSVIFIGRGINLIIQSFQTMEINNEQAVGFSDVIICLIWLIIALLVLMNREIGIKNIFSIIIQGSLLFITLLVYMIAFPIIHSDKIDTIGLITITIMALFFIIPMIKILKRKLAHRRSSMSSDI